MSHVSSAMRSGSQRRMAGNMAVSWQLRRSPSCRSRRLPNAPRPLGPTPTIPPVDYRILGPLEVWRNGGAVNLGAPRQRALLIRLLLGRSRVVSVDRLADDL